MLNLAHEFSGHDGPVYAACVDQDFLYTASADKFVARWNLKERQQDSFSIKTDSAPISLETAESQFLMIGLLNGELHIVDLFSKQEVFACNLENNGIFSLCYNPFQKHLYVGTGAGALYIFCMATFKQVLMLPLACGKIRKLLLSNKGDILYLACQDGNIRGFDTGNFNELACWMAHDGGTNSFAFLPKNTMVSGGKDGFIRIWHLNSKKEIFGFPAHKGVIYDMVTTPGFIISASRDKTIKVWKDDSFSPVQKIQYHKHAVNAFVQHNDDYFVSVSDDKKIAIWVNEH